MVNAESRGELATGVLDLLLVAVEHLLVGRLGRGLGILGSQGLLVHGLQDHGVQLLSQGRGVVPLVGVIIVVIISFECLRSIESVKFIDIHV